MVWLCGLALCISRAQEGARAIVYDRDGQPSASSGQDPSASSGKAFSTIPSDEASRRRRGRSSERALSADDRLAVIASALDSKTPHSAERDCSHLVHAIYERAGFPYAYASSDDLYAGVQGFQRVSQPQSGDLVVWPGHAGIVIRPSRHVFFSFLHSGPGTDDYRNRYWRGRGQPRFYRYLKNDACPGCTVARGRAGQ
jgi:cell wall-associated NlpC family hydrolase